MYVCENANYRPFMAGLSIFNELLINLIQNTDNIPPNRY